MIFCIPASESRGLDAAFEPDFGNAVNMVIYNADTLEAHNLPVDPANHGAGVPAYFEAVLCGRIDRDVWRNYLYQGIRFYGISAATVREAIDKFSRGDITAVNVSSIGTQSGKEALAVGGCGCGRHRQAPSNHVCCGGKGHGHGLGACGGHGKRHGGCGCG